MSGLNGITYEKGKGGLNRPLPGEDHYSSLTFYVANGSLPSGFTTSDRIKKIFSVEDAEDLGILDTFADETKAAGTYLVTNAGALNDTIEVKVQEYPTKEYDELGNLTGLISLGVYTRSAGDTTVNLLAASIAAFINLGTLSHGYTASVNTATVTITARKGLGVFLNTGTPISIVLSAGATIAGVLTQPSAATLGVASLQATWHYHISEFFRIQPLGVLFLNFYAVPSTYDFTDLVTVQQYAGGKIRQFAVFCDGTTYSSGKIQAAQLVYDSLFTAKMPGHIVTTFNYQGVALSALADLAGLNSQSVSLCIGQDGYNLGYKLYKGAGKSISNLGAVLGAIAFAKVSESIAWLGKFNLSNGNENDVAAFSNGVLFSTQSLSLLNTIHDYRYIFFVKEVGFTGTYLNDSHTCTLQSSDYAYIENNRTIDKAIRLSRIGLLPFLSGPLILNSDGTLKDLTIETLVSAGEKSTDQMVRDEELSGKTVSVSSTQNVQSTNKVVVGLELLAVGVGRNINVKIKYVESLT